MYILPALFAGLVLQASPSRPIDQLAWLIGDWSFSDEAQPAAGFAYREVGQRRCDWALDRTYIRCESRGSTARAERTYVFYITYNARTGRFEMTSLYGNIPDKLTKSGMTENDGRTLVLRGDPYVEEGHTRRSWSILRYDGEASYVWMSGSGPDGSPEAEPGGAVRFLDRVVRTTARPS